MPPYKFVSDWKKQYFPVRESQKCYSDLNPAIPTTYLSLNVITFKAI